MSCLIPTLKIKELAAQFPNETVRSVTNLISSWQEDYNKSVEEIPSTEELKNYISEIRKSPLENSVSEKTINIFVGANKNAQRTSRPTATEGNKASIDSKQEVQEEIIKYLIESNNINSIKKEDITYTDDDGKPCAKIGLTNAVKGTNWKIVKDFKGQPKHSQGGVDITISDKGVSMRRGGKDIKAAYGLLIPNFN